MPVLITISGDVATVMAEMEAMLGLYGREKVATPEPQKIIVQDNEPDEEETPAARKGRKVKKETVDEDKAAKVAEKQAKSREMGKAVSVARKEALKSNSPAPVDELPQGDVVEEDGKIIEIADIENPTFEDVRATAEELYAKAGKGEDALKRCYEKFNVVRLRELKEEQYPAFIKAAVEERDRK